MTNEETFKLKMNVDDNDSIIYVCIPHATVRRAVAGVMALVVGFLGIIGLRVDVHTGDSGGATTEVPK
jgi:hypothetical protein